MNSNKGPTTPLDGTIPGLPFATPDERLMFYTEVLLANIPSIISDLGSAKNTFLSISEKKRNEMKQKSALIQSISRTYGTLNTCRRQVQEKSKQLEECEAELAVASPPKFVSAAEAQQMTEEQRQRQNVVVLQEEDLRRVRKVDDSLHVLTEDLANQTKNASTLESEIATLKEESRTGFDAVREAQEQCEQIRETWRSAVNEMQILNLTMEEQDDRTAIEKEAAEAHHQLEEDCKQQEYDLINACIQVARDALESLQKEVMERREKNEVELAAFQIAHREMQGEIEVLKDNIHFLKDHQKNLERLAKQQQMEEKQANSLKKLMWSTFSMSSSNTAGGLPVLKQQQEEELVRDHPIIMRLCAYISKMEENRQNIAAFLLQVTDPSNNGEVKHAVQQIEDILDSNIVLDEDALNDNY